MLWIHRHVSVQRQERKANRRSKSLRACVQQRARRRVRQWKQCASCAEAKRAREQLQSERQERLHSPLVDEREQRHWAPQGKQQLLPLAKQPVSSEVQQREKTQRTRVHAQARLQG